MSFTDLMKELYNAQRKAMNSRDKKLVKEIEKLESEHER